MAGLGRHSIYRMWTFTIHFHDQNWNSLANSGQNIAIYDEDAAVHNNKLFEDSGHDNHRRY